MSSNAFASSRPRGRHQPMNRRRFVDHPRFIKLVQELARLNEIKNAKQQQDGDATAAPGNNINATAPIMNNINIITNNNIIITNIDTNNLTTSTSTSSTINNNQNQTNNNQQLNSNNISNDLSSNTQNQHSEIGNNDTPIIESSDGTTTNNNTFTNNTTSNNNNQNLNQHQNPQQTTNASSTSTSSSSNSSSSNSSSSTNSSSCTNTSVALNNNNNINCCPNNNAVSTSSSLHYRSRPINGLFNDQNQASSCSSSARLLDYHQFHTCPPQNHHLQQDNINHQLQNNQASSRTSIQAHLNSNYQCHLNRPHHLNCQHQHANSSQSNYNQQFICAHHSNNLSLNQEDRSPAKTSSSSNYTISKHQPVDQNNPGITNSNNNIVNNNNNNTTYHNTNDNNDTSNSNNNNTVYNSSTTSINATQLTPNNHENPYNTAQDENRSKRKRSTTENLNNRKATSSDSATIAATNKKLKSTTETARPLSPSFTKCPICLLDCMDRDPSFTNTCFHLFCYVCIENWSKNKTTCPLCRTKFTKIIFNIKSAKSFEEKLTMPVRRDDDDAYIADRHFMMEHLTGINSNNTSQIPRNNTGDEVQFIFDNLRNHSDVLMPQYFVNQIDPRQDTIHFASSSSANYNPNVPTNLAFSQNYPIAPNYAIALSFQRGIPPGAPVGPPYTANTNLTNLINEANSRRNSRSGRYIYGSDGHGPRVTRATSGVNINTNNIDQSSVSLHGQQAGHQAHQNQSTQDNNQHNHHHHNLTSHLQQVQGTIQGPGNNSNQHSHQHHHQHPHHHHPHHVHPQHLPIAGQQPQPPQQPQHHQTQTQTQHQTQAQYQATQLRTTIETAPRQSSRAIAITAQGNTQVPQMHPRPHQNMFTRYRQAYSSGPHHVEHPNFLESIYRRGPDM